MSVRISERQSTQILPSEDWPVTELRNDTCNVGTVLVISSGKARSILEETEDSVLLHKACLSLADLGFHCVNPMLPLREDGLSVDDEDLIRLRLDFAAAALNRIHGKAPVVILAMSLGVQTALLMAEDWNLANRIDALVLLSGVVEQPIAPIGKIRAIDLVYGSRDHVGYLQNGSEQLQTIIPPQEYGKQSLARLVLAPGQDSQLHLIRGAGHTLHVCQADGSSDSAKAVTFLQNLIALRVGVAARFDKRNVKHAYADRTRTI